jgi:hypothetical protein
VDGGKRAGDEEEETGGGQTMLGILLVEVGVPTRSEIKDCLMSPL